MHRYCTAPGTPDDNTCLMPVEFGLGDTNSGLEVIVGKKGIENSVSVGFEVGWLDGRLGSIASLGGRGLSWRSNFQ